MSLPEETRKQSTGSSVKRTIPTAVYADVTRAEDVFIRYVLVRIDSRPEPYPKVEDYVRK